MLRDILQCQLVIFRLTNTQYTMFVSKVKRDVKVNVVHLLSNKCRVRHELEHKESYHRMAHGMVG